MNAPLVDRQPSNRIERLEALGIVWKLKAQQRLRRRNAMGIEPGDSYQSISLACHDALTWRTRVSPATTPGQGDYSVGRGQPARSSGATKWN
jgi:hypothetical protein